MKRQATRTPLERLQERWQVKACEPMPESIARLPIGMALAAVELLEDGQTPFVPSDTVRVAAVDGSGYGESMQEWDTVGYV